MLEALGSCHRVVRLVLKMLQPPQKGYELLDPAEDVEEGAAQRLSELAVPAEPAEKQKPASELSLIHI